MAFNIKNNCSSPDNYSLASFRLLHSNKKYAVTNMYVLDKDGKKNQTSLENAIYLVRNGKIRRGDLSYAYSTDKIIPNDEWQAHYFKSYFFNYSNLTLSGRYFTSLQTRYNDKAGTGNSYCYVRVKLPEKLQNKNYIAHVTLENSLSCSAIDTTSRMIEWYPMSDMKDLYICNNKMWHYPKMSYETNNRRWAAYLNISNTLTGSYVVSASTFFDLLIMNFEVRVIAHTEGYRTPQYTGMYVDINGTIKIKDLFLERIL